MKRKCLKCRLRPSASGKDRLWCDKCKRSCSVCKRRQRETDFTLENRRRDRRAYRCKTCAKKYRELPRTREMMTGYYPTYRSKNAALIRLREIHRQYGISPEDYIRLESRFSGGCFICKTVPKRWLCVDHDHETGVVRGLVCDPCNNGLARFKEDQEVLSSAIEYLRDGGKSLGLTAKASPKCLAGARDLKSRRLVAAKLSGRRFGQSLLSNTPAEMSIEDRVRSELMNPVHVSVFDALVLSRSGALVSDLEARLSIGRGQVVGAIKAIRRAATIIGEDQDLILVSRRFCSLGKQRVSLYSSLAAK